MSASLPEGWASWEEHDAEFLKDYPHHMPAMKAVLSPSMSFCGCCGASNETSHYGGCGIKYALESQLKANGSISSYVAEPPAHKLTITDPDGGLTVFWSDK